MNSESDNRVAPGRVAPGQRGLLRTVEKVCGAQFLSEKLSLFSDTRDLLANVNIMNIWLFELYVLDSDEAVTEWLAGSLPDPAALLVKYLLFQGFYMSSATSLREYAETVLGELESVVLSTSSPPPLYHDGHLVM